ncbi:MAG: SPOR domain-containing protein [Gammaproteobacteria bacterium]|jgi:cell division septation protein DedD|nr:SPOR domain-containing protein [Gammaproteobacteria bacterium]MBT5217479.1 SPOR domain-containing protein [Gammaproteobacteria bacterium]MBT5542629.1 SPOR domain-containing protein [Gammaproteobacteria bacterium]MBT6074648.1 SPOR domain-containing protein [Gammaproteobacteria bacterium]MBT7753761.1 SPOR domain-containing protein [Gammaproteobacteria bacterium]
MKEKLIGSITLVIIIVMLLFTLLQGEGMENLDQYRDKQKNIISQEDYTKEQFVPQWTIQIAAYSDYQEALSLAKKLEKIRMKVLISERKVENIVIYRVRILQKNKNDKIKKTVKRLEKYDYKYQILKPSQQ